jgi:hypothetical protein
LPTPPLDHHNKLQLLHCNACLLGDGFELRSELSMGVESERNISGPTTGLKLVRRHKARLARVALRLLQPPHRMNYAQFKRLMREKG